MSISKEPAKLGKLDVFLGMVCGLLFVDYIASNTLVGISGITWWIVIGIIFYIPNGLITAELAATYPDKGGIYSWIKRAFGSKWASRTSFIYWMNNTIWIPSAYIWFSNLFCNMFLPNTSYWIQVFIGVILTWVTIWIASLPLVESKWITNFAAICKIIVFIMVSIAGVIYLVKGNPMANPVTLESLTPSLGQSLRYLPVIVLCCCGLEVLSASAHEIKNPKKDLPKSIISVAILVILFNIIASFSTLAVIPLSNLDSVTGVMDVIRVVFSSNILVTVVAVMLLFSVFAQIVTWTLSTAWGASESGAIGELPKSFGVVNKNGYPLGALIITGLTASAIIILYGFMAEDASSLFFTLLAFSSILFFMPYIIMFMAYIRLKNKDKYIERSFVAPYGKILALVCQVILYSSMILFIWIPGEELDVSYSGPIIAGVIIVLMIGEYLIKMTSKKNTQTVYISNVRKTS